MKKILCVLFSMFLLFFLFSCKKQSQTPPKNEDNTTGSVQQDIDRVNSMFATDDTGSDANQDSGSVDFSEQMVGSDVTAAQASIFIGRTVEMMESQIGPPNSKSYSASTTDNGENGIWIYDHFTAYTFRSYDGSETVVSVL